MLRLSALIVHLLSEVVVSTAAVSDSWISRSASASLAPFTSTVSLSRSMPFDDSQSSFIRPLMRRSLMKPLVLSLASCIESSLMTTRLSNNGRSCMLTVRWPMSAMVSVTFLSESFGCSMRNSSMPRSKGHSRFTWPTVISIPVFSEAMAATFFTAQFCTGGK